MQTKRSVEDARSGQSARQSTTSKSRWPKLPWRIGDRSFSWFLVIPALLFFVIWNAIPLLWMVGLSFYRYTFTSPSPPRFAGLANFADVFTSFTLWSTLGRTFAFMTLSVVGTTLLGVALGFLFWGSTEMPGRRVALTLLFSPMLLTPIAVGTFFSLLYNPNFGLINYFVEVISGQRIDFLSSQVWAFPAVLAVDIWMWTPFMTLITLAALGSVPNAELEAAEVDRLSWWRRLRHVVLPHAKFILMLGILLRTILAFKTTDLVFLMTRGGPGSETELIGLRLYRLGFEAFSMGDASAIGIIVLLMAIAFTSIFLYVLNLRRHQT